MTDIEETLVYDAMRAIHENAPDILTLVRAFGTKHATDAFREGVYVPCVKLQCALGEEALARGKARHEKIKSECAAYFAARKTTNPGK